MASRKPYQGPSRKLIIALDVGTTYSGISYSILDPGSVPETRGVTRFPAQEHIGGDAKIPSILFYDQTGMVRAVGAEALQESVIVQAEEEEWVKSEWFKLHLRPRSTENSHITYSLRPLPLNKTVVDVFSDFLRYLFQCARTYIQQTHPNGAYFWSSIANNIEFILTHPNGWEGAQQKQMRKAAVRAGLISNDVAGQSRIHFVTEGEASLHFCVRNGLSSHIAKDKGVIIVDAGGGTIDLSAYSQRSSTTGTSFEECATPQCHFTGSIFVTMEARGFLEAKFRQHKSAYITHLEDIVNHFDSGTKLRFASANEPAYIKFGNVRDKDLNVGITSGRLKLAGTEVASFFEPSIKSIVQAIVDQRSSSKNTIKSIFLVGGFAASDYLFSKLDEYLKPLGLNFCRPDSHVNKAVADGAISFYLDHYVSVRISRVTYGSRSTNRYNSVDPEHARRSWDTFVDASGETCLAKCFSVILAKDVRVSETREFRQPFYRVSTQNSFDKISESIECYRGRNVNPCWTDVEPEMYTTLCTVVADTSRLNKDLRPRRSPGGLPPHYRIDFDIILSFGLTELKAQIAWNENGVEKRSPAEVVYDSEVVSFCAR